MLSSGRISSYPALLAAGSAMRLWEILFLVEVGGFLVQAGQTSITEKNSRPEIPSRGKVVYSAERRPKKYGESVPLVYLFSTTVSDPSRGFLQSRSETRSNSGEVKGEYSYMDGFYKVKVKYIAGASGFRVLRQERVRMNNTVEAIKHPSSPNKRTIKNRKL